MKTIKDFKQLLNNGISEVFNGNTLLGVHLNGLFNEDKYYDATVHHIEEKIEVIVQMNENGIDCFKDSYKIGSVSKAFYQWNLKQYSEFK